MTTLFIDADACPVKEEAYKVARRYGLPVKVVANAFLMVPSEPLIERVIVDAGPDMADDWIAERAGKGDVVVTADIPLASRCLKNGAQAIGPGGRAFTTDSIGAGPWRGARWASTCASMGVATSGSQAVRRGGTAHASCRPWTSAVNRARRSRRDVS